MKKLLSSLLLGVMVLLPFAVNAETITGTVTVDKENPTVVQNSNGTETKSYKLNLALTSSATVKTVTVNFVDFGSGITAATCTGNENFTATKTQTSTTSMTCTFTAKNATAAKSFVLGTVDLTSAPSGDCSITVDKITIDGEINPGTGLNIPYVVMGSGVLLAGAIYIVTRRHNKLYKI